MLQDLYPPSGEGFHTAATAADRLSPWDNPARPRAARHSRWDRFVRRPHGRTVFLSELLKLNWQFRVPLLRSIIPFAPEMDRRNGVMTVKTPIFDGFPQGESKYPHKMRFSGFSTTEFVV